MLCRGQSRSKGLEACAHYRPRHSHEGMDMARTTIEWTECSWNPVTGCSKISAGCEHCYAERMARRLCAMGQPRYRNGFEVTLHRDIVDLPLHWRKPRSIFVNSMSDLFHEKVPDAFIASIVETIDATDWHRFQLLTKRAERIAELDSVIAWPSNAMIGVTVEHRDTIGRIDALRASSASRKFISFEPLIGPVGKVDLRGIDWVIVGGESGPGARPMEEAWVLEIKRQTDAPRHSFLLQAMGRRVQEEARPLPRRPGVEREAGPAWPARLASIRQYRLSPPCSRLSRTCSRVPRGYSRLSRARCRPCPGHSGQPHEHSLLSRGQSGVSGGYSALSPGYSRVSHQCSGLFRG